MERGTELAAYGLTLVLGVGIGGALAGSSGALRAGLVAFMLVSFIALYRDLSRPSGTTLADAERDWNNARSNATIGGGVFPVLGTYLRLRRARHQHPTQGP